MEPAIPIVVISCIVCVATFLLGRQSVAKKDGQEWGAFTAELKTDISYIKRDVSEIKVSVADSRNDTMAAISREGDNRRDSVRRLHEKIDDHLVKYHNVPAPIKYTED